MFGVRNGLKPVTVTDSLAMYPFYAVRRSPITEVALMCVQSEGRMLPAGYKAVAVTICWYSAIVGG